jgi:hypothetical protein
VFRIVKSRVSPPRERSNPQVSAAAESRPPPDRSGENTTLRLHARAAGAGYLVIIATGIFAEFFVRSSLIVRGDPAATAGNIADAAMLFRSGLAAELVMLTCDVFLAYALYVVFRGVSRRLALLAAFLRITHAAVVAVNLLFTWLPLQLATRTDYIAALAAESREAFGLLFLEAHAYGYTIGLVFFGVQCAVLGVLVLRSTLVPRLLGVLLLGASIGYLIDSFARTLLPAYADYEMVFTTVVFGPAFIAELSFALWLLLKGVRTEQPLERMS